MVRESLEARDNFFFAVLPDEAARQQARVIADEQALRVGPPAYRVPASCFHVSLAGLGDGTVITEGRLAAVVAAVDGFTAPAFRVAFNRLQTWAGQSRPWVLTGEDGVVGFQRLLEKLRMKLKTEGFEFPRPARLTPHMTLARNGPYAHCELTEPVCWTAVELVLVRSHVGEGRYTIVARWSLKLPEPV
ncbi:MAG: hypothetical protein JSR98_10100 [Proteobacteria bacterium]|nr:hypothetical protein [Pseudomonadota bacterium]